MKATATWMHGLAALLATTPVANACSEHPERVESKLGSSGADFIGAEISGTWYAPERNGEGLAIQMMEDGRVSLVWFTYPPLGEAGEQAWMLGVSGAISDNVVRFEQVVRPLGARFGAAFDPADVQNTPWGSIELSFLDCNHLRLRWSGPAAFGSGERELTRLSAPAQLGCGGQRDLLANGARALSGLRSKSGTWFVPERSGEGWLVDELPGGVTGVYWFTYDEAGRQRWILGTGTRSNDRVVVDSAVTPVGTRFGADFSSGEIVQRPFGRLELQFTRCSTLDLQYTAFDAQLGSAQRNTTRLTRVAGLPCVDGTPAPHAGTAWQERAQMPGFKQSELAVARRGDEIYAIGGFGGNRSIKRYRPLLDEWDVLPDMPDGRHHLAAFALPDAVYAVGGGSDGFDPQYSHAYRFRFAQQAWEPVANFLPMFGSHAAVLHGRAYVGNLDGALHVFEPHSGRVRRIEPQVGGHPRDHSQVVAFMDEIWMIAGRSPETRRVAIYDPVDGRWREGPPIQTPRGGFAAAVVGPRIVIAGGEVLGVTGASLVDSVEVYTVGDSSWRPGLPMPVPVHGTAATEFDGRFYLVSGSVLAGRIIGATGRVFALEFPP